jgi:hypothetical protein
MSEGNRDHEARSGGGPVRYGIIDPEIQRLGQGLVKAAKKCNVVELKRLLDLNAPVNYFDRSDQAGVLHYIAAYGARPSLRVMLKSGRCDFLLRDGRGRLPSELAREFGHDDAMARLLLIKEMRQAQAQGIDPSSLYKISAHRRDL